MTPVAKSRSSTGGAGVEGLRSTIHHSRSTERIAFEIDFALAHARKAVFYVRFGITERRALRTLLRSRRVGAPEQAAERDAGGERRGRMVAHEPPRRAKRPSRAQGGSADARSWWRDSATRDEAESEACAAPL